MWWRDVSSGLALKAYCIHKGRPCDGTRQLCHDIAEEPLHTDLLGKQEP